MEVFHKTVMVEEVVTALQVAENKNFIDGTCGSGGHSLAIFKKNSPQGKVLCVDLDPVMLELAKKRLAEFIPRVLFVNDNYYNLPEIVTKLNFGPVHGLVLDLGMSSLHLVKGGGFSFLKDEPLDMRYNPTTNDLTAYYIVNNYNAKDLRQIFKNFADEPKAGAIANAIVRNRKIKPIKTTFELVKIIEENKKNWRAKHKHPATLVFQALRIAVNDEFGNLEKFLNSCLNILESKGRLAIITFHSLEDRMVKNFFRQESKECLCPPNFPVCRCGHRRKIKIIYKKAIKPGQEEIKSNPSSRSAQLRVIEKI